MELPGRVSRGRTYALGILSRVASPRCRVLVYLFRKNAQPSEDNNADVSMQKLESAFAASRS